MIGVVGGSGGVGASTLAAVLARVAGQRSGRCVLVDIDPNSGGIDVLLGIEREPGARWSGLRLGGGLLEPDVLWAGLPRVGRSGSCAVLAADTGDHDAATVAQVLETAQLVGPVVLDLPRGPSAARDEAVARCRLVVVLARSDLPGLVAARAVLAALPGVPTGLVVRRGDVRARQAAGVVCAPLLGELPAVRTRSRLDLERLPSSVTALARGVLDGVAPSRPALQFAGGWA